MENSAPYNPLDKAHLAESIVREFFKRPFHPLPPTESFTGAGIYALYYDGDFPLYCEISESWAKHQRIRKYEPTPIYIGKSDPPGSRKGVFVEESEEEAKEVLAAAKPSHRKLHQRLKQHRKSIASTKLQINHFHCRYMLVDEIWVPLGEARLVEWFKPLWNVLIEGFGSNVEGGGRSKTARPVWDILHPGRKESLGFQLPPEREKTIVASLRNAKSLKELRVAIKTHRDAKHEHRKKRTNREEDLL